MKTMKLNQKIEFVEEFIVCDKCGVKYEIHGANDSEMEAQEFLSINFTGGYASIFGDMDKFECDLCQYCMKELLGQYIRKTYEYNWFKDAEEYKNSLGENKK